MTTTPLPQITFCLSNSLVNMAALNVTIGTLICILISTEAPIYNISLPTELLKVWYYKKKFNLSILAIKQKRVERR